MRQVIVAGVLAATTLLGLAPARAEELTFDDEKVADAIERAKTFLLAAQLPNGSWSKEKLHDVGITAMCTYALLEAGVKPTQEDVKKALTWLTEQNCTYTYSLALRCQAYLSAERHGSRGAYKAFLKKDAELLAHSGLVNGGRYSYNTPGAAGDNSNSQYGLLGVWAAAQLGLEVPEGYWERVAKHWQGCQGPDGGWHYDPTKPAAGKAFATMTAAGIATVLVCFEQLTPGAFADCRGPNQPAAVENGLDWMERYFVEIVGGAKAAKAARELDKQRKDQEAEETKKVLSELSPDDRQRFQQEENKRLAEERKRQRPAGELHGFQAPAGWMYYFLYGVERVGLASGYKYFGTADWYKVGAERLLNEQSKNGRWGAELFNTAFATIFLVRGRHPILFNKLSYRGRWRNRPHDLPNLARWIGDNSETTVNWQSINPSVPVRDWHDAPIVYIAGSTAPYFTPAEIAKLRRYVEEGGTILSVAECGGADFKAGIRLAYQKIFPQYEMAAIKPDHEMNTTLALLPVAPAALPPMFAISNGVRPLAVHIEGDLPKSWQMRRTRMPETAFEIGANVT
ncbi:MAG: DUF4159 domain-containing protein, partial [Planctomycetota bacterium]|nr:DUF4159 domain-containing protein [Planctomycetota bacterium]